MERCRPQRGKDTVMMRAIVHERDEDNIEIMTAMGYTDCI